MNRKSYIGLKFKPGEIKFNTTRTRLVFIFLSALLLSFLNSGASPALCIEPRQRAQSSPLAAGLASELKIDLYPYGEDSPRLAAGRVQLKIHAAGPPSIDISAASRPDQLPQSRVVRGNRNIITAWYAGPTDRYRHGVLGDRLEASRLVVETAERKHLQIDLPSTRVFEDLEPRLVDLNGDDRDELIVVESDLDSGASLAVYGIVTGRLVRMAATPFLGRPNRWLNPLGVGDFDGDGHPDIALVATPHIGGILRLYRFEDGTLSLFAEFPGVSTHRIGSTELGLGRVIPTIPRDRLLVPNQARRTLMLVEWSPDGWHEVTRAELPGTLASSLIPVGDGRWRFRLENGKSYEIQMEN